MLFFTVQSVTQADRISRLVVFALIHEYRAACVVSENLVRQVQAGSDEREAVFQPQAALNVELQVRQRVDIAARAFRSQPARVARQLVAVSIDARSVVSQPDADRNAALVVSRADVPVIRRLALQRRMIRASRECRTGSNPPSRNSPECREPRADREARSAAADRRPRSRRDGRCRR